MVIRLNRQDKKANNNNMNILLMAFALGVPILFIICSKVIVRLVFYGIVLYVSWGMILSTFGIGWAPIK